MTEDDKDAIWMMAGRAANDMAHGLRQEDEDIGLEDFQRLYERVGADAIAEAFRDALVEEMTPVTLAQYDERSRANHERYVRWEARRKAASVEDA